MRSAALDAIAVCAGTLSASLLFVSTPTPWVHPMDAAVVAGSVLIFLARIARKLEEQR